MPTDLLIVESPSKAKTIARFLDKNFSVQSCFGHIRDLKKQNMGIDTNNNYAPQYEIAKDKASLIKQLKKAAAAANEIWLATDEDREGEAISWHLCEVLALNPETTKRIVFHEITKNAIETAIKQPRFVNMDLVNAQQARRILDRIVGFKLSGLLQQKLHMGMSLSAGRVQSVVVRLIVEKEEEITHFQSSAFYKIKAIFEGKDSNDTPYTFSAEGNDINELTEAEAFLTRCIPATYEVKDIRVKPRKRSPPPPFTTSTLQQEAAQKLGYAVARTMQLAQKLYENGHITYMRTDSVHLSESALSSIGEKIVQDYGKPFHHLRRYKTKNTHAQEAHEAIRPTQIFQEDIPEKDMLALYKLIWKRTMASQMADALLENTQIDVGISTDPTILTAKGDTLVFEGFLKIYHQSEENEAILPPLRKGDKLTLQSLTALERHTQPTARYSEASLVKKMEQLGIGRPSTYAQVIATILKRNYVHKGDKDGQLASYQVRTLNNKGEIIASIKEEMKGSEKSKLSPTELGKMVTQYLRTHFENIMDYHFTASIEEDFDKIAEGNKTWVSVVDHFYHPFMKDIKGHLANVGERIATERLLGEDEKGQPVYAKFGRFGAMIQIGDAKDEKKPLFASIPAHLHIESITLEEALHLFSLPREIGCLEKGIVILNVGRFGPYATYNNKNYPLGKIDPYAISNEEALAIVAKKAQLPRYLGTHENEEVWVNNGPYGAYAQYRGEFCPLPKDTDLMTISLAEVIPIITAFLEKLKKRTLHTFPELNAVVLSSRCGPILKINGKKQFLPKHLQTNPEKITEEEIRTLMSEKKTPSKKKK